MMWLPCPSAFRLVGASPMATLFWTMCLPMPTFFVVDDEEDTWPAYRSAPVWMPFFAGSTAAGLSISDVTPLDVPDKTP
ncbi:hypothetical protein CYMTET_35546 [Cymbomonas tetramitiformis]|uniref:Secreted protein n=1 Tax=Cymbomonas tetramitiformis TaxID=36881 RepID=A0AAE0F8Z5_9CHLO|nr:hypothetical protein CYMTET_35546 [Cymbomonas tetramitiformis]